MKGAAKLSERIYLLVDFEMSSWLDEIVGQGGFDSRAAAIRSLLQTIMEEDKGAHSAPPDLHVVEGGA